MGRGRHALQQVAWGDQQQWHRQSKPTHRIGQGYRTSADQCNQKRTASRRKGGEVHH
ncbi:MAG: hypothetical protein WCK70_16410 [Chloroflexales bacterium]